MNFDEDNSAFDVIQGDLAMNIFIVLLVVLSVFSLAASTTAIDGFKVDTIPTKKESPLAALAGWNPVQPLQPKLLLREGVLYKLDTLKIAKNFYAGNKHLVTPELLVETKMLNEDRDPASYSNSFYFEGKNIPKIFVEYAIPVKYFSSNEAKEEGLDLLSVDLSKHSGLDLLYFPNQSKNAAKILTLLYEAGNTTRMISLSSDNSFTLNRSSSIYAFEDAYK